MRRKKRERISKELKDFLKFLKELADFPKSEVELVAKRIDPDKCFKLCKEFKIPVKRLELLRVKGGVKKWAFLLGGSVVYYYFPSQSFLVFNLIKERHPEIFIRNKSRLEKILLGEKNG